MQYVLLMLMQLLQLLAWQLMALQLPCRYCLMTIWVSCGYLSMTYA